MFEKVSAVADAELAERLRRQIPDGPPSMVELRSVLKGLKKGKASKDNLVMELYQEAGDECLTLLHRVCVQIFEEDGTWPDDWVESVYQFLYLCIRRASSRIRITIGGYAWWHTHPRW